MMLSVAYPHHYRTDPHRQTQQQHHQEQQCRQEQSTAIPTSNIVISSRSHPTMKSLNDGTTTPSTIPVPTGPIPNASSRYVEFQVEPKRTVSVNDLTRTPLSTIAVLGDGDSELQQPQHKPQQLQQPQQQMQQQQQQHPDEVSAEGRSPPSSSLPSSVPGPVAGNSLVHDNNNNNNNNGGILRGGGGGGFGMTRSHTLQSLSASSTSSSNESSLGLLQDNITLASTSSPFSSVRGGTGEELFTTFGLDVRRYTDGRPDVPMFEDKGLRHVLEPHMRKARLMRERARNRTQTMNGHGSISSSIGVPYVRLRSERPFLYDTYTHPIHEVLAETLGVQDLTQIHKLGDGNVDLDQLFSPLRSRKGRRNFHESYDNFVTSFCIPLLHSMALAKNVLQGTNNASLMSHSSNHSLLDGASTRISYRYQAFPRIRVVRPGDTTDGPQCDTARGHSVGFLRFHVPLTPTFGTNALYTESHPGKEDWHPLLTKSVGLGFLFDGGRCINFNLENTTDSTMVALDFCIAIYNNDTDADLYNGTDDDYVDGEGPCTQRTLEDCFSDAGPGFYDDAVIDVGIGSRLWQVVAKKCDDGRNRNHLRLLDPDERVGFPFTTT